jgi:hypothetical protein
MFPFEFALMSVAVTFSPVHLVIGVVTVSVGNRFTFTVTVSVLVLPLSVAIKQIFVPVCIFVIGKVNGVVQSDAKYAMFPVELAPMSVTVTFSPAHLVIGVVTVSVGNGLTVIVNVFVAGTHGGPLGLLVVTVMVIVFPISVDAGIYSIVNGKGADAEV